MSESNPYAVPQSLEAYATPEPGFRDGLQLASQGQRFVNLIVDNILVQLLAGGAGFVVGASFALMRASAGQQVSEAEADSLELFGILLGIGVALVYFVAMELTLSRTVGKLVSGTRVVNVNGGRPSFGQVLGRTFARYIPFDAFSFLFGKGFPVGWHDSLSGTRVVKAR